MGQSSAAHAVDERGAIAALGQVQSAERMLWHWADASPEATAILQDGAAWSFADLARSVRRLADQLGDLGVRPGDRVAIVGENDVGVLAAMFAAWTRSACAVPLNARYTPSELSIILGHAEPRITLFAGAPGTPAAAHANQHGAGRVLESGFALCAGPPSNAAAPDPLAPAPAARPAQILYTSGTSGAPKGVVLPHRAVIYMADLWARTRTVEPGDLVYQALPLSHSYGLNSLALGAINRGCRLELVSRFDPAHLHGAFARGVALFQGVPAMYARYLAHLEETGFPHRAPQLKALAVGGSPLDPELKRRVEAVFGIPLRQGYGLTEAGPGVTMPLPDGAARSLGVALPGTEVRVADPQTGQPLPDGAPGELQIRSPGVMLGYYRAPELTAEMLTSDGWLRTGDLVETRRGEILLAGRARDVIIRSGFNVFPPEVEAVLTDHPAVLQAAVVGRSLPGAEEEVVAFVEARPATSIDIEDLAAFCALRLAGYKRPGEIIVLDQLPIGPTGKVHTPTLRALANRSDAVGRHLAATVERDGDAVE